MTDKEIKAEIVEACMGLAQHEVHRVLLRCYAENDKKLNARWIRAAKSKMIMERFQGAITIESAEGVDVGGNEELLEHIDILKSRFGSAEARAKGIPEPKGLMLVGFPGCGKSLTPKAIARKWGMTLVRLNLAEIFSKYVGESEQNAKAVQGVLEALAPCVVWIDEIEKGFAGTGGNGDGDSGTSLRVFGAFLSWLQDKKAPVFVVATANNVTSLRDELKRKGRFDEIFFVDIPTLEERIAIAKIHIASKGAFVKGVDAQAIANASDGYSGAEIEAAIIDAMGVAFYKKQDVTTTQDVLDAMARTTPLSQSSPQLLPALRKWAADCKVRRASKPAVAKPSGDMSFNRTINFNEEK